MQIKIFLTNLAAYNRGSLIGEWVTLPVEEDELQSKLDKILAAGKPGDEEYFITDYEPDSLKLSEYTNIFDLNEQATEADNMDEDVVETLLQSYTLEETIEIINNGEYFVYTDCSDMGDVAREVINESGMLNALPENLQYYFDYEAYGRDLDLDGVFIKHPYEDLYVEVCN